MAIKLVSASDKGFYFRFGDIDPAALTLSASGKAFLVETCRGSKWVPVSVARLQEIPGYHPELLLPGWFCQREGLRPCVKTPI